MNNLKKTLVMTLVALATAFGLTTEAKAAVQTLKVGQTSNLSLVVGGRYVNPTLVSATSSVSGVVKVTKYGSLSSGRYFAKVTAQKAGTAKVTVRYGSKLYYYNFSVVASAPVPPTPSFAKISSAKFRLYCGKVANATAYRLRVNIDSSDWSKASVTSATTNPTWTVSNQKKGVKYYYWIDVKGMGSDGKLHWYGKSTAWRCVTRN